jgi:hypothetical protein
VKAGIYRYWVSTGTAIPALVLSPKLNFRWFESSLLVAFANDAVVLSFTFVPCCRFDELCARRMTKRYR